MFVSFARGRSSRLGPKTKGWREALPVRQFYEMTGVRQRRAFSSLLTTTEAKGTGLGLAIVGRIVEAHRGTVRIVSGQQGGTRIIVSLPVGV